MHGQKWTTVVEVRLRGKKEKKILVRNNAHVVFKEEKIIKRKSEIKDNKERERENHGIENKKIFNGH